MFYDCKNPVLSLCSVAQMHWSGGSFNVSPRPHGALAFRIKGEAVVNGLSVGPGEVLYLPAGLAYRAEYTDTEVLVFHFTTADTDPLPEVCSASQEIRTLFTKAVRIWEKREPGYVALCTALLYEVLGALCREAAKARLPAFQTAMELLNRRVADPSLSVAALCREAGMGESAFRAMFRKQYGKTPVAYMTELRLERARTLLATGETVESAAFKSGFNDPKYFARVVRKFYGCSPRTLKNYGR